VKKGKAEQINPPFPTDKKKKTKVLIENCTPLNQERTLVSSPPEID
jgi:hypothetical protein